MERMGKGRVMEWIDASEWIPEENAICLVCDAVSQYISLGRHIGDNEWLLMGMDEPEGDVCITHWIRIPAPPEVEE